MVKRDNAEKGLSWMENDSFNLKEILVNILTELKSKVGQGVNLSPKTCFNHV